MIEKEADLDLRKVLFEGIFIIRGLISTLIEKCWKLKEKFVELNPIWERYSRVELGSEEAEKQKQWYLRREKIEKEKQKRKEKEEQKRREFREYVYKNLKQIAEGEPNLIFLLYKIRNHLYPQFNEQIPSEQDRLEYYFGKECYEAYLKGLKQFWKKQDVSLNARRTNRIPGEALVILEAVTEVKKQGQDLTKLDENLARKALIAACYNLNTWPEWFEEVALSFPKMTQETVKTAIEMEIGKDFSSILNRIVYEKNEEILTLLLPVVWKILETSEPRWNLNNLKNGLRVIKHYEEKLQEIVQWTMQKGKIYWKKGEDKQRAFYFLVFWYMYDWENAWKWLKENCFKAKKAKDNMVIFLNTLKDIFYGDFERFISQSQWLMDLIPLVYKLLPPENDPVCEARDSLLNFLLREDNLKIGDFFKKLIEEAEDSRERSRWSYYYEKWHQNMTTRWQPLKPNEVKKILFEGYYRLKTPRDLYELTCDLIREIKEIFEKDEASLTLLLYEKKKRELKATRETYFQIAVVNQLKLLLKNLKVCPAREPHLIWERKPDIRLSACLDNGKEVRVHIEMKKQNNPDLYKALENQLVNKYLQESETDYGIYLVGWFDNNVPSFRKNKPKNAHELQELLQKEADELVKKSSKVKGISVFVIDLSSGEQ